MRLGSFITENQDSVSVTTWLWYREKSEPSIQNRITLFSISHIAV